MHKIHRFGTGMYKNTGFCEKMYLIAKNSRKSWTFWERTDIIYTMRNVFTVVKYNKYIRDSKGGQD